MSSPKRGYEASPEWVDYYRRKTEQQRSGRNLSEQRLAYVERCKAVGEVPMSFTRWLPLKDTL
jgi:hypothetical protein